MATAACPALAGARVFPGTPEQVQAARAFVARYLAGCPARETLRSCVSELCTNAILHTASGAGGVFTVEVLRPRPGAACVAVTDQGSAAGPPRVLPRDRGSEDGRGLALVAALAGRWGYHRAAGGGLTVWAEATWPVPVPAPRCPAVAALSHM